MSVLSYIILMLLISFALFYTLDKRVKGSCNLCGKQHNTQEHTE